jgi:hypothetical protein
MLEYIDSLLCYLSFELTPRACTSDAYTSSKWYYRAAVTAVVFAKRTTGTKLTLPSSHTTIATTDIVLFAQDYEAGKPPANSIALAGAMLHKSQDPDNTSDWRNSCFEIHSSDLLRSKRNKEGRLYFKATSGE